MRRKYSDLRKRIDKDIERKQKKRKLKTELYGNLNTVITTKNYIDALRICNRGVSYKNSVQKYNLYSIMNITDTINTIKSGKVPKVGHIHQVAIRERGKERIITPIKIDDRITQRVICDNTLVPLIAPKLIYDNGASMKGKGTDFARNRINEHIEKAKREFGNEFYALVFDFKGFFDSIPHSCCYNVLDDLLEDKQLRDLVIGIIESYQLQEINLIKDEAEREKELARLYNHERIGICLGSQISQLMALVVPNAFDHYIKDTLRIKHYVRYMDDGVILHSDKEYLIHVKELLSNIASKYGLRFNDKKTMLVKMSKGFVFLKVHYRVIKNGKTIKTLVRSGTVRMRRKLKKYRRKVDEGEMTLDDVYSSMQSWLNHAMIAKSYHTRKSMLKLYDDLFDGYKITRKYFKAHPDEKRNPKLKRKVA